MIFTRGLEIHTYTSVVCKADKRVKRKGWSRMDTSSKKKSGFSDIEIKRIVRLRWFMSLSLCKTKKIINNYRATVYLKPKWLF